MAMFISEGTANGNQTWVLVTNDPITLDTTLLTFTQMSGPLTTLDSLTDVNTTSVVDGSLLRYESASTEWLPTTASTLLLNDAGQLQVPTTGSAAGILIGGDAQVSRAAANVVSSQATTIGSVQKTFQARNLDATNTSSGVALAITPSGVDPSTSDFGALLITDRGGGLGLPSASLLISTSTDSGRNHAIAIGSDQRLYFGVGGVSTTWDTYVTRGGANIIAAGTGDKFQSDVMAIAADDLTNQVYVDRMNMFYA